MHLQDVLNNNQEVYGQVGDGPPENVANQPMKKQCHVNAVKSRELFVDPKSVVVEQKSA